MYPRETQLAAQVGTAQYQQKVDEFLKIFDIAKAEQVACYLAFIFGLGIADNPVPFQLLLKAAVVEGALIVPAASFIDGVKLVSQP